MNTLDVFGRRLLITYSLACVLGITGCFYTRQNDDLAILRYLCGLLAYGTGIALFATWIAGFVKEKKTGSSES